MLRLIKFAALVLLSGVAALACAGEAGHIVFLTGQVRVAQHPAVLDGPVQEGDELSTGADGYIYLKTIDNGFLVLRPNSKARIIAYHIDDANPANTRVKLELVSGVARSISGQGVKKARQNFRFNTPVAAIGVRGTDFVVFTDQQTSRVAVMSGGVIVSGFAAGCGPEGGGPCEGGRELFAGQSGLLLQVERDQKTPQLMHNQGLSPDQNAAPRGDEPVGKVSVMQPLPSTDISLDAQKDQLTIVSKPAQLTDGSGSGGSVAVAPTAPVTPVDPAVPVVPVVPVVPTAPANPQILWGRWQTVANMPTDPVLLATLSSKAVSQLVFVGPYVMGRLADPSYVLPTDGMASFTLTSSEAVMQKTGQDALVAQVSNASLNINFAAQTFNTSLTVSGLGKNIVVNGVGEVSKQGLITNSAISDSIIRGFVGGSNSGEAGYLFQNTSSPGITVMGSTKWAR